ncbi:hypothetical protein LOTGIDRAFT_169285 [Lottia gigantea]|uniref:protein-tyrosine-phosphatase n=1 Tax=Lottia gigantea TaxID=225164 RepID=V3ZRC2_LOTGI|nr:hypothetical protein LOTGIDRAFT_169285 [Lottia gigantea]ESO83421.1 hypothetical protein LOTGIDRAFT_169285 [Lottia gigantea]
MACNHINNIAYLLCVFLLGYVSCNVGDGCNRGDVRTCGGKPAGTGYQCDNSNRCQCTADYYDSSGVCTAKLGYNGDCSNSNEACIPDLICYTATSTCKCNTGYYRSTNQCKPEVESDSNCNPSDTQSCTGNLTLESGSNCNPSDTQPCTGNLTCINNKCGCQDDHYLYDNNCYPKLGYNGDCSNSNEVCIPDLICYTATSTCKCNTGYYRSTNQCKPGTDYTNIKITTKVRTDRGSTTEDAVSDEITDSTNPGKPGPLNSDNNYDTTKVMNIGFVKPTGGVDKYIVEITGPGLNTPFTQEPTTNSITLPANTLQPGRQYTISIIAVYNGKNSTGITKTFNTSSRGSDPVKDLNITNINSRNLTVSWFYPDEDMGVLTAYILDVKIGSECIQQYIYVTDINNKVGLVFIILDVKNGSECIQQYIYVTDINNKPTTNNCAGVTPPYNVTDLKAGITQMITDLLPYINYTLIVTPYNKAGPGSVASKSAQTLEEAAGEPSNLNVPVPQIKSTSFLVTWNKPSLKTGPTTYYLTVYEQKDLSNNQASQLVKTYSVQAPGKVESLTVRHKSEIFTSAEVSWSCVKERNRHGVIMNYTLTSTLVNEDPRDIQPKESCTFTEIVGVKPGEDITFTVFATNMDFKGEETVIKYPAPTGKPKLPKEEIILIPNSEVIEQTSFSVTVCPNCLRDETNGPVKITALLVCVKGNCDINDNQLTVAKVRSYANWQKVSAQSFDVPYRVTNDTWYGDKDDVDKLKFVVGTESDCDKQSKEYFCNGPLKMDTEYQILAVSCTEGGCSVSQPIGPFKTKGDSTDDSISPAVAAIISCLVTVIAMVIGIAIYCLVKRRRSKQKESKEGTVNYTPHSNGTSNPETAAYVNLPNRNSGVETAAYYVNVPDQRNNEEQGPYASLDDDLTPPVYETLK